MISSWPESNKLTRNIKKTQLLLLGPNNSSDKKLIWNGEEVKESKCVKYLGVKIDNKLTFEDHIDYVQMKCYQYISILYQTKKYLQRELLLKIYKQYVQPQYQCGVLIYGTANKSVLERLQHQQNFLIRIIFGSPKHKEVRSCRSKDKIPSIFELHVCELLKLLSKVIRREHPCESINSFLIDKDIDRSFDNEQRIKTIPLIEKLTRKTRKPISVRLRILYNSLSTLDFDIKKSLKTAALLFIDSDFYGKMYW